MRLLPLLLLLASPAFAQFTDFNGAFNGPVVFRNLTLLQGQTISTGTFSATDFSVANLTVTGPTTFTTTPAGTVQRACVDVTASLGLSVAGCKEVATIQAPFLSLGRACDAVAPLAANINLSEKCRVTAEGTAKLYMCSAAVGIGLPTGQWCAEVDGYVPPPAPPPADQIAPTR